MPDRLPGVWKDRRILLQKFLQLIQATDFDSGRRLAMAYDIGRNEFVERFGLTVVPSFQEASDHERKSQSIHVQFSKIKNFI